MSSPAALPARRPSVEEMNEHKKNARRYRAEWILGLEAGALTIADVFEQADESEGAPLLAMRLRDILTALSGSPVKSNRIINQMLQELGVDMKPGNVKVRWLMDRRSRMRRMVALADVMVRHDRSAPTKAWPW